MCKNVCMFDENALTPKVSQSFTLYIATLLLNASPVAETSILDIHRSVAFEEKRDFAAILPEEIPCHQ